ncbi:MAG: hypothetical protein RL326_482 [Pseudomonadota bacterium]|jgi:hypothetical protein
MKIKKMKKLAERFVVEFSQSQKAFHIQELSSAVSANARRFWHKPNDMFDWVVLFVGTQRQCEIMVSQSEKRLQREEEPAVWMH